MDPAITGLYLILIILIIRKAGFYKLPGINSRLVLAAFALKLIAGLALYFVYTRVYTNYLEADIFKYYHDSSIIDQALRNGNFSDYLKMTFGFNDPALIANYYSRMNFWEFGNSFSPINDSQTIIRVCALLRAITTADNYSTVALFFIFFSFTGLCGLYRFFRMNIHGYDKLILISVFCIPSVVFWTSGILKESLLIFFMGIFLFSLSKIFKKNYSPRIFIYVALSLAGLILIKTYILFLLIPSVLGFIWSTIAPGNSWLKYLLSFLIFIGICSAIGSANKRLHIPTRLAERQYDFNAVAKGNANMTANTPARSRFEIERLNPDYSSVIKLIPDALFNTFIRPSFVSTKAPLTIITGIENILMLIFFLVCLLTINSASYNHMFLFCLLFTLLLFILVGMTVPIMGAVVRYKVPALILIVVAFGSLSNRFRDKSIIR